jgi:lipopolysaccharide/colanic/teichoic acid biosynthesis glycosyltransferase
MVTKDFGAIPRQQVSVVQPHLQLIKRIFDLGLALLTLPLVVPLAILCVVAIRLDSPGPILFIQERVGKAGRLFRIYKFRTMIPKHSSEAERRFMKAFVQGKIKEANFSEAGFKPAHRSKITTVGRILRKLSLDELPQLINVFQGNMSLIGPRPNVAWEVEAYNTWHRERLDVLPGITGLAQVKGRSNITFDEIVRYDVEYISNQSLWLDLKIMVWTVSSVISGKGAG